MSRLRSGRSTQGAFTLLELLVATTILAIVLAISLSVMDYTMRTWRRSIGTLEAFQGARTAFDLITRSISQATLNTYSGYDDILTPRRYRRESDLHFVIGKTGAGGIPGTSGTGTGVFFQAPLSLTEDSARYGGLDGALNVCGYYVEFGEDSSLPSHVTASPGYRPKYRYRLMNLLVPVESNHVFDNTNRTWSDFGWFKNYPSSTFPVAENIIALVVHPEDPGTPSLFDSVDYNSLKDWESDPQPAGANQLPPLMQVTAVAIDESASRRLEDGATPPAAISGALSSFQSKVDSSPADIGEALDKLGADLSAAGIGYRIFSTKVPMRESKWTKE